MNAFDSFRHRGVARLTIAGLLSETGDWLLMIALPLYVLQLTGSALITAATFVLELLPSVFIGPFAGALVDRLDRWRVMTVVAVAQAIVLFGLLGVRSRRDLWIVYIVIVVESILGTVIEPARAAAAPALVPVGEVVGLNALLGMSAAAARLVGGPLGGVLFGTSGLRGVVIADAATFAVAAALLAPGGGRRTAIDSGGRDDVRRRGTDQRVAERDGLFAEWRQGMRLVASAPPLRRIMGVTAFASLAQGAFLVLFVLFVTRDLSGSSADVGMLRGVQAIGAIAGGLALSRIVRRLDAPRLLAASLGLFGLISLTVWNLPRVSTSLPLYVCLFIVVGAPGMGVMTATMTMLQSNTDDAMRGRVMSTFFAASAGMQAVGMLLAGLVGTGAGLTTTLEVQGGLYLTAGAMALRLRPGHSRVTRRAASYPAP